MLTTTITHYAVQVEMFPADWLFVVDTDMQPVIYTDLAEAEKNAAIWASGSARIVTRDLTVTSTLETHETPWRLV